MSAADTLKPFVSGPWLDTGGNRLSVRPLPGLGTEAIQSLEATYPGILSSRMKALLGTCCGLAGTELGNIDFTGCWFAEEPYAVFRPALTLAIDDAGRRWIAELGNHELPGPIWCVLPDPEVTLYASDDLETFVSSLHQLACNGEIRGWLHTLSDEARSVWSQRHALAVRPHHAFNFDRTIRSWLLGLPFNAYVYDLRERAVARGWPHGVAGPASRKYRCGRLPVFAVAGRPVEGWRARRPRRAAPTPGMPAREPVVAIQAFRSGRPKPRKPRRWLWGRQTWKPLLEASG